MKENTTETKDELLKSFHEQFAENQNHHQTVFIQFISAVFIVIVGYAIVYTNTIKGADFISATKDKTTGEHLVSYAIIHLIGSYFLAQIILTLLCTLTMNIGYGFRRDQNVNHKIRKHYFSETVYNDIFGTKSFNPTKKKLLDFLPEFNSIFVKSIILIQFLLTISILYILTQFDNFQLNLCKHWVKHGLWVLFIFIPILFSLYSYRFYYKKYKNVVG